ncbi:MAG: cation:proton antiporter [Planctomycetota bacterium]
MNHGFAILGALVTLAAVFSWINHRFLRWPTTIGLMIISMAFSVALVLLQWTGLGFERPIVDLLLSVDFDQALLHGMLGALLFAGALHVKLDDLKRQRWMILALSTAGVLISTILVGLGTWTISGLLGLDLPFLYCLLFGALISPTDPIAVGAILKRLGVPPHTQTVIAGESLFNDGVGVVLFIALLGVTAGGQEVRAGEIVELLAVEAGGGMLYGAILGWIAYHMLYRVDDYHVEILITLALVTGGFAFADVIHVSGPLAMVVCGIVIGNPGRAYAMSKRTRTELDSFWGLVDEFLNAVLFVMIGVEVLVLDLEVPSLEAGLLAIFLVLAARWLSVSLPVIVLLGIDQWLDRLASTVVLPEGDMRAARRYAPRAVALFTWSGLRGGISVALALSLPAGHERDVLLMMTYVVVAFSIIVQGLTVERVVARLMPGERGKNAGG